MAKNEDGEFELVLGNKQLISVFLIVVILLGVFFSMGYIVGRNSAPAVAADSTRPTAVEPAPAAPSHEVAPVPDTPEPIKPEAAPTRVEPPPAPAPRVEPPPPPKARPAVSPPPQRGTIAVTEPGVGEYWQVVATARPDAEIITEALTKKGFHAIVAPAPREGVFRVLVGPFRDASTQAQTRTALEAAGFKNPIMRKY